MRNKIYLFIVIIGILAVASCKKDNPAASGSGDSGHVKTITMIASVGGVGDTTTTNLSYDNQGRVVTEAIATSLGGTVTSSNTITYTYSTTTVVQTSSLTGSVTYNLNSMGYRVSDNNGDSWAYNSNGYLIKSTTSVDTTTYTYNALNQLATQTQSEAGGNTIMDTYTYSANPISQQGASWSTGESTGALWTTDVNVKNGDTTTLTFAYTTNNQGQLTGETVTSSASGTLDMTYFTYY
jgi:hypothetical protein